jgi:hypothetical protein
MHLAEGGDVINAGIGARIRGKHQAVFQVQGGAISRKYLPNYPKNRSSFSGAT